MTVGVAEAPPATLRNDRRRTSAVLIGLAVVALIYAATRVAVHDPRAVHLSGDQATYLYNALSLQGGDLSYDAEDHARWVDLGWEDQPLGLFLQARADGWAFAKPYGYSALLAAPLAAVGIRAVSLVGAVLVLAYAACWYAAARLRWDRPTAAVLAATATVASHAWFYGFPAHADLFVAALVGAVVVGCLRARLADDGLAFVLAAGAAGLLLSEKVAALGALVPLLLVAAWDRPARIKVLAGTVAVGVAVVAILPYLYYSDGETWSPYGGERYQALGPTPWSGGSEAALVRLTSDEVVTVDYALERLTDPSEELPAAALTYAVGRHTGVLTFLPVVPALLVATAWARRRTNAGAHHRPDTTIDRPLLLAAALGLASYVAFYLLLFTDNYYGGGQSIGSRYFLQISVLAAAVPVAGALPRARVRACAAFGAVWALVVLGPNLLRADRAFGELHHTSPVQRLLPFETTQTPADLFADPDEPQNG